MQGMPIELKLLDDQYPFEGFTHTRPIARAIAFDKDGNVAIHRICRNDIFCGQTYFETPGGGVDEGETYEQALVRECDEELGAKVEVGEYLGEVIDAYNLIKRQNVNRYYIAYIKEKTHKHFASLGDTMIQETIYVPLDEAIRLYENMEDKLLAKLVKQRELPILLEAKRILSGEK